MESFDEDQRKYIKVEVYHINLKRSAFIRNKTSDGYTIVFYYIESHRGTPTSPSSLSASLSEGLANDGTCRSCSAASWQRYTS